MFPCPSTLGQERLKGFGRKPLNRFLLMSKPISDPPYAIAQLDEIEPKACPCGQARRAFQLPWNQLASVHLVEISKDSRAHYHKIMTEIYVVIEGTGYIELDGELIPVKPMSTIMIRPGCVHRAIGNLKIINIPMPPFDPADEYEV